MAEVTALKAFKKGRVQVELDGEPAFVLYKGEAGRLSIEEGRELSEAEKERIFTQILLPRAVKRLLFLLGRKDYTESQLYEKLVNSGCPADVAGRAIEAVKDYGYTGDADYVRRYLSCYGGRKSRGYMRMQLAQRGISRTLIEEVFAEWEADEESAGADEQELIRELLARRHYDPATADAGEKRRQYAYLARRGFKSSDISAILFREAV